MTTIEMTTHEQVNEAHREAIDALVAEFGDIHSVPQERIDAVQEQTRKAHEPIAQARQAADKAEENAEKIAAKKIAADVEKQRARAEREAEQREKAAAKAAAPKRGPGRPKKAEPTVKVEREPWPCEVPECDNLIHPTGKPGRPAKKCESCRAAK